MAEGAYFNEIPKFKSPEEELDFLRSQILEKERELKEQNKEVKEEKVISETIKAYHALETETVLPEGKIVRDEEANGIVLRLKPEAHDRKMEELLGILTERGLKNALAIIEKLGNPHLDDDFHRFLVQYLSSTHAIPGLKESSPIFKALNMKLFEVTLPEQSEEGKKGFKDFIQAMEQFYAGMQSVADSRENLDNSYYTLEIALSNASDEVVVYAAIPEGKVDLFEKQILAFYHDAKVTEVADDYNVFSEGGAAVGAYAKLQNFEVFPVKVYDKIDHDPMNIILNAFSKLKKAGEGASIQIVFTPSGERYVKKFSQVLRTVKDGMTVEKAMKSVGSFEMQFASVAKELIFGVKTKEEKEKEKEKSLKKDDEAPNRIVEKLKSTILGVTIRVVAAAETTDRAAQILGEIESSFNQFDETNSNNFVFEKVDQKKLGEFLHNYSYRLPSEKESIPLNLKELASIFHFPIGAEGTPQLKQARAGIAPAPVEMGTEGILLGYNDYRGRRTEVRMAREDRVRHMYVIGQTGTGKTNILLNMITQDIKNGDGCCYIDPHGTDIQTILSRIPKERIDDVIYFDPAYTARPMGLNMLEYDPAYPEQKTFVVNELMSIFNKLFTKESMGPMFDQYFKNSAFLIMDDPENAGTLLEITRVLGNKEYRDSLLVKCKNPIIKEFWINAEQTTGEQSIANFIPYITSKFDNFISNDIMRPVVMQKKSVFNFREIMDNKKILLVNLAKGRLGDINSNLIGLVIVNKIQMAALSRVDMYGKKINDFYLYIDEFQNVTTDSIASILSEARKYRLSLTVAHQYISQLEEKIKNAVFGNVGSMAVFRVSPEDATLLEPKFKPVFTAQDIIKIDNYNAYMSMLVRGQPTRPFNIVTVAPEEGNIEMVEKLKQLSYLKYGRDRAEVEDEIMERYKRT